MSAPEGEGKPALSRALLYSDLAIRSTWDCGISSEKTVTEIGNFAKISAFFLVYFSR